LILFAGLFWFFMSFRSWENPLDGKGKTSAAKKDIREIKGNVRICQSHLKLIYFVSGELRILLKFF
jgi:hypothetical protein